jgi:hypothetical protein
VRQYAQVVDAPNGKNLRIAARDKAPRCHLQQIFIGRITGHEFMLVAASTSGE